MDTKESFMKKFKSDQKISKFWRSLKKTCLVFIKVIWEFIIRLYNKFMELPRKIRYILAVWLIVLILLVSFIGVSNNTRKFYSKYSQLEAVVSAKATKYVEDNNIYATQDHKLKLDLEILKSNNYISDQELTDETCSGISVIYYDDQKDEYVVDSYLNCDKYTTKNYWDYK